MNTIEALKQYLADSDLRKLLTELNNPKLSVRCALACAEDLEQFYSVEKYAKVFTARQRCLELVGNWLIDSYSVSNEELRVAANSAVDAAYAANAAAYAAYAAAANAAYAANADAANADAAAYAANAAANADAAAYAANAAAANNAYKNKLKIKVITLVTKEYDISSTFELFYINDGIH